MQRKDSRADEYETGGSMHFMAHKQGVIEFNHVAPSKVITLEDGVEMIEKGRSLKGNDIKRSNQLKLDEYRKLHDPRQQQVADTLKKKMMQSLDINMMDVPNEDPYKSFRRSLIHEQKNSAR